MVSRYEQMMLVEYEMIALVNFSIKCVSTCDQTLFSISVQSLPL